MIDVTGLLKIKHAGLYVAVKKVGGQSALARFLGVSATAIGSWCNLTACPRDTPSHHWPAERIDKLDSDLLTLTGQTLAELFPPELRDECLRNEKPLVFERNMQVRDLAMIEQGERQTARLTLDDPAEALAAVERENGIAEAMKTLSYRERESLKMRYGLDGNGEYTLDEIGELFGVTKERVRQIEARAIRKLLLHHNKKLYPLLAEGETIPWLVKQTEKYIERKQRQTR